MKYGNDETGSGVPKLLQNLISVDCRLDGAKHAGLPSKVDIPLGDCTLNCPEAVIQDPVCIYPVFLHTTMDEWRNKCLRLDVQWVLRASVSRYVWQADGRTRPAAYVGNFALAHSR